METNAGRWAIVKLSNFKTNLPKLVSKSYSAYTGNWTWGATNRRGKVCIDENRKQARTWASKESAQEHCNRVGYSKEGACVLRLDYTDRELDTLMRSAAYDMFAVLVEAEELLHGDGMPANKECGLKFLQRVRQVREKALPQVKED